MKRPTLFLDIDGVLNSHSWWKSRPNEPWCYEHDLDPAACALLAGLQRDTGCDIVVSSTWRKMHPLKRIAEMIHAKGGPPATAFVGVTPQLDTGHRTGLYRGHEIQAYMDAHPCGPIAIVDDDSDMAHLFERFVRTSVAVGLTRGKVRRLAALLSEES